MKPVQAVHSLGCKYICVAVNNIMHSRAMFGVEAGLYEGPYKRLYIGSMQFLLARDVDRRSYGTWNSKPQP